MKKKISQTGRRLLSLLLAAVLLFPTHEATVMAETFQAEGIAETVDVAGAASPANPVHHCDKENGTNDTTTWSYVYFGSYPQTEVTGSALTAAITGADYDADGDAWVNGTKYRRISKGDTNYGVYFEDSAYRYFKWERIKWRVLQNDGSTLFVVADRGIDCKDYNEEYVSVTWEDCTLRSWLNSDFYGAAFSGNEQGAIVSRTVVNEDNPFYGTEGGNNTKDKVYLLSIGEATNLDYGFCEDYNTYSASRWMQTSDYAHARGAYLYSGSSTGGNANCCWWLRSPGNLADDAALVHSNGYVPRLGNFVNNSDDVVVPALHINLSSDLWSFVDDGTSGEGGDGGGGETGDGDDTGNAKISCIKEKEIAAGKEGFLFVSLHAENEEAFDAAVNTTTVVSSDESVLTIEKGSSEKGIALPGDVPGTWLIKLRGRKAGKASVTLTMQDGTTVACSVTVTTAEGRQPVPVDSKDPAEVAKAVAFSMEDYVSDISGEDATVYGPMIDVFGKQFSLFELNASTKIGMENLKAEVSYDVDKKLVKVLVGVDTSGKAGIDGTTDNRMCNASWSEEYNQFKNLYKQMTGLEAKKSNGNGTYWNQFEKLKGKMNRFQCKLMVDASMYASGYMEWSYASGELKFSEGGFVEQASVGTRMTQYIPEIPLAYWFIKVTADEKGHFLFRQEGSVLTADFALTPSLAAELGVGMGKSEGKYQTYLEASMEAVLAATIANKDPKLKVNLTGNLHARGEAFGYDLLNKTYPFMDMQIYPREEQASASLADVSLGDAKNPYLDAKPLSRDYLKEETDVDAVGRSDSYSYVQDNVFPYCEPHLFALSGGRYLLLYVGDNGTKSANNRTSLMYAVYDGARWSQAKTAAEDGTYADGISAYQEGDRVYVAYRKAGRVFSDEEGVEDITAALDLYVITFDGESFSAPVCISGEENGVLESGQVVYAKDGTLSVAWLENSENDIFLTSGKNSLHMRTEKDGVWSQEVTVLETEDVISEINLGEIGGALACVYTLQDLKDTLNNRCYLYSGGNTKRILSGYAQPGEYTMENGRLYFLNNDTLYSYDGSAVQEETGISGVTNYQLLEENGARYLLANVPTASGSELYLAEESGGAWGSFRQFTDQKGYIRNYSAVLEQGSVKAAVNRLAPDPQEEGSYKTASLLVTGEEEVYDLAADYVYYEETAVVPGNNLPLEIGMTNRGKNTVTEVTAVLKDGSGAKLGEKKISCSLESGQSGTAEMGYVLPETLTQRKISVTLSISREETETENNTVSTEIHYIDLAVKGAACRMTEENTLLVTGTLANQGLEDIRNIRAGIYYGTLSGEKLDEVAIDTLRAGESVPFAITLPGDMTYADDTKQLGELMIYAKSDAEERNYINNEARLVYNAKGEQINNSENDSDTQNPGGGHGTGGDTKPSQDGSGSQSVPQQNGTASGLPDTSGSSAQEVKVQKISVSAISKKIAAGKKVVLAALISPENASGSRINWTSSNKNYASVNSKGVVTTKKAGAGKSVTITAAAADGSGVKAKIKLKLMKHAVTKVRLKAPKKTLKAGTGMKLQATVKTNGKHANKALKWTSSNPGYAAVSSKGKVTAKKAGKGKTVTITVMSTDGTNKKAKVKIKIK